LLKIAKNVYKVISLFFHEKYCILRPVFPGEVGAGPHQAERAGSDTDHACIISYPGKSASPLQKLLPFWSGDAEVLITTGYWF
jgi:hypothetical protein